VSAIMELIAANDLLEEAGVEVTAVSARERGRVEMQPQVPREAELQGASRRPFIVLRTLGPELAFRSDNERAVPGPLKSRILRDVAQPAL